MLATIPVTLAGDAANPTGADGGITLREAIAYVNGVLPSAEDQARFDFANLGTNDKIVFDLSSGQDMITLTAGELNITKSVTIDASMLTSLTIDAAGNDLTPGVNDGGGSRVFDIQMPFQPGSSFLVELVGLTITGGDTDAFNPGGGIRFGSTNPNADQVTLTLRDSVVTGNHSEGSGGGFYSRFSGGGPFTINSGQINFERSLIRGNTSNDHGGGVFIDSNLLDVEISQSTVSGNTAANEGGGLYIFLRDTAGIYNPNLTIDQSTISGNVAGSNGGGLFFCTKFSGATLDIANSTLSGNASGGLGGRAVCACPWPWT